MARPDLFMNRKFYLLARRLGSRMLAVGALECVWAVGYSSGCPMVGGPEEVEAICEWTGEKGALSAALIEAGFLDEESDGSLTIHDLYDHAPAYVQKRMRSEAKRKLAGTTISELRRGAAAVRWEREREKQADAVGMHVDTNEIHVHANDATPTPKDAFPFASEEQGPPPSTRKRTTRPAPDDPLFAAFWNAYPKKVGKADAERAWKKLSQGEREKAAAAVSVYAEAMADRPQYVKDPSGWLNGKRFDDDPSAWQPHGASRKTSDTAFPPTKPVGTKYADTPTVRL